MKVLVAVKRVVDYTMKIRVNPNKTAVDIANVKMSMNPFCEIAVEEAVRLREANVASEVIAVSIGAKANQEILRTALAFGADRAIHIETDMRTDQELQPLAVAKLLKHVVEKEKPNLVLVGKQSIDGDNNQTGQLLAGLLDWPQVTFASEMKVSESKDGFTSKREVDTGLQVLKYTLPAVVTADLRLNEPRYPKLPNIVKARKKPLDTIAAASTGVDLTPRVTVEVVEEPPIRKGGGKVADVDELLTKLKGAGVL